MKPAIVLFLAAAIVLFAVPMFAQGSGTLPAANASLLLFSAIVGAVFRPVIEFLVHKIETIPDNVAGALAVGVFVLIYVAGWALFGGKGGAPSDLLSWAQGALDAVGMGSVIMSGVGVKKAATE